MAAKKAPKKKFTKKNANPFTPNQIKALVGASPKTGIAAVEKLHNLLSDKTRWTKGKLYANENDAEVPVREKAVKFCLIGAIRRVNGPTEQEVTAMISLAIIQHFHHRVDVSIDDLINLNKTDLDDYTPQNVIEYLAGFDNEAMFFDDSGDEIDLDDDIIIVFNDSDDTTHADVLKVVKQARKNFELLQVLRERNDAIAAAKIALDNAIIDGRTALKRLSTGK